MEKFSFRMIVTYFPDISKKIRNFYIYDEL